MNSDTQNSTSNDLQDKSSEQGVNSDSVSGEMIKAPDNTRNFHFLKYVSMVLLDQATQIRESILDNEVNFSLDDFYERIKASNKERVLKGKDTLRQRTIDSMLKDKKVDLESKIKTFIKHNGNRVNEYKKLLYEGEDHRFDVNSQLFGEFAKRILSMDDPKKVLILIALYNEGMFKSVFEEIDKDIVKQEDVIAKTEEDEATEDKKVE